MAKDYAYYPGCSLHATAREYDTSFRLVSEALGLHVQELKDWICCGASSAHATDHLLGVALPAHTLKGARETHLPLMVPCAACFSRLKTAAHDLEDEKTRQQVEQVLGGKLGESTPILHPLQVLVDENVPVKKPLAGLKVACYYGCLLVRPPGITKFDDVDNPQTMDRLMKQIGAEPVAWGFKTECCGAGMNLARKDMVLRLSRRILGQAKQAGAECVVTACPMCHSNLDLYQGQMSREDGQDINIPIFYFTQLMGLAMGFSPEQMMLSRHFVDALPLLRAKGLVPDVAVKASSSKPQVANPT
ncbi:MAG: CoB--CoM heterodisulfide reductase iron-sulfur subunit B family protein [Chloroflexi bacterium]|nr:CoB--CoM heterodisulfide reductase iron-sulfur subunit B family protein [Chloroflexota bacterium]